jgi:N-acylneuraminate cytidylyltransferase
MTNLAVIPARGGSKRIPRKNIKHFFGKPIIGWTIEAALASQCFDRIVVSTDDDEIAQVARAFGAETPFNRPSELANDHAGTIPVVAHATRWCIDQGDSPSLVCCLYATAPFITPQDLQTGLSLMQTQNIDYAFAVSRFGYPIQRAMRIRKDGRVEMLDPTKFHTRSQDLEEAWHDAGQFYWGRAAAWLAQRPVLDPGSAPIVLPSHRVQDIDTPDDWARAEVLFQLLQNAKDTALLPNAARPDRQEKTT